MRIIGTKENELDFVVYDHFDSRLFSPIGKYVIWKLENDWDDYNELYHTVNFIESLQGKDGIWYEIHTIEKNTEVKGVLTIVGVILNKLEFKQ